MCPTSPTPATSLYSAVDTARCKAFFEAVNCHAAANGMRIKASKTKVMSALIPGEQRQAVLLEGEPLEDVNKFKYLCSRTFKAGLNLLVPHSLAFKPVFCRSVKYRCVQGAGLPGISALNFTLQLRDMTCTRSRRRMLEVFDNDSIRRILRVMRRDCMPSV